MIQRRAAQALRIFRRVAADGTGPLLLARRAIGELEALQRTWELQSLLGDVKRLRPAIAIEIGTHRGGTLISFAALSQPNAELISIDMPEPAQNLGSTTDDIERIRSAIRPGQTLHAVRGDSHSTDTLEQVRGILRGRPADFLWIDGDHTEAGVRADLRMYGPLVRPGGLVAFHDIQSSDSVPHNMVHVLWTEVRTRFVAREYIEQNWPGGGMGIGVIEVPAGGLSAGGTE